MARTTGYQWWRPVVGTVIVLASIVVIPRAPAPILSRLHFSGELPVFGDMTGFVLGQATICLLLPLVLAVTSWVGARPAGTITSVTGRLRWHWLGLCLLIAVPANLAVLNALTVLTALTSANGAPSSPNASHTAGVSVPAGALVSVVAALAVTTVVAVAVTIVQCATEEYVTRGWILQAVGAVTRGPWLAIGAQAMVFTVPHGLHGTKFGYLDLGVYAILIGWLTVSTGGIEAAIAMHVAFNTIPTMVACVAVFVFGMPGPGHAATVAGAGWQLPAVHLPVAVAYVLVVHLLARTRVARTVPGEPVTATPPSHPAPRRRPIVLPVNTGVDADGDPR
jgi:CAAX protease family protein